MGQTDDNVFPSCPYSFLTKLLGAGKVNLVGIPCDSPPYGNTFNLDASDAINTWIVPRIDKENIYYCVNEPIPTPEQTGKAGKLCENDVALLRGFVIDIDPGADESFEESKLRFLTLTEKWKNHFCVSPTAIVNSGNGIQLIWMFKEPLINDNQNRVRVKRLAIAYGALLGGDATHSVDHLFRLPGTYNFPNRKKRARGRQKAPTTLLHFDDKARYTPEALESFAPEYTAYKPAENEYSDLSFNYFACLDVAEDPKLLEPRLCIVADQIRNDPRCSKLLLNSDRSSKDFGIAAKCVEYGLSDMTDIGQVTFSISPDKLLEKEGEVGGEDYARRTIRKALTVAKPRLTESIFQNMCEGPFTLSAPNLTFGHPVPVSFPIPKANMPRRKWLVAKAVPKNELLIIVGPPKVAKSNWTLLLGLAVASGNGQAMFGTTHNSPWKFSQGKVLVVNNEDSLGEMNRRLSAHQIHTGIIPEPGQIHLVSGADNNTIPLTIMECGRDGIKPSAGATYLQKILHEIKPDLVIFDSLASLASGINESDNSQMDSLIRKLRSLTSEVGATALVVHHTSKTTTGAAGDINAARGASSIIGAARGGYTFMQWSEKDRNTLGLPSGRYVRLDSTGQNYSPHDSRAHTWRITSGEVGNGSLPCISNNIFNEDFHGDTAAVMEYMGALSLKPTEATEKKESVENLSKRVALVVLEVVGDAGRERLSNELSDKLSKAFSAAGISGGKSRSAVIGLLKKCLSRGVTIDRSRESITVLFQKEEDHKTAPLVLVLESFPATLNTSHSEAVKD